VVLQYPSRRELIRELKKGYDYVAISFLLALFHRMKDVVALVREHAPFAKIVLGGYGAVLSDEELAPYGDHICREEGVAFMRRLLGEPELAMPYHHPLITSTLKVFGARVSHTGMIFAGLGCPSGCDFCCTSHFFERRHIKLLPTGEDIHRVAERYVALDPDITLVVLDEDFLLNRRRAMAFRESVLRAGKPLSIFAFASIRALSQYTTEEIVEMGIDGLWIGYEGTRSGYAKQEGRPPEELFVELREHGVSVLASMIVGLPYQDDEIVEQELAQLLALEPDLCQFLIYGPVPGTPFFEQVVEQGRLREEFHTDRERFYKVSDGFTAMVKHPKLGFEQIEEQQRRCYREEFQQLGPTIYRSIETWLKGYRTLSRSTNPALRQKAQRLAREVRKAYPVFLAGRLLGPNRVIRRRIGSLQRDVHAAFGRPRLGQRLQGLMATGLALWTSVTLKLRLFQHPRLVRHAYRMPAAEPRPARIWRKLRRVEQVATVELRPAGTIWLGLHGAIETADASHLAGRIRRALQRTRESVVLDLERLTQLEHDAANKLVAALRAHRDRIRVLMPSALSSPGVTTVLAIFSLYRGSGLNG